jgi:hypothetical protein
MPAPVGRRGKGFFSLGKGFGFPENTKAGANAPDFFIAICETLLPKKLQQ